MEGRVQDFIRALSARTRVLLLGGHAVIHYGMHRETKDADIWCEPLADPESWATLLSAIIADFPECYVWDLAARRKIDSAHVPTLIADLGVIRIGGLNLPLDIFRRPNNLDEEDFAHAWTAGKPMVGEANLRVLDEIEMIVTKEDTDRHRDREDITFLESRIRERLSPILAACSPEEARAHFARYADHVTCEAALRNPHPEVRALATETLREFAAAQNPFARELLRALGETPP
jgi:hypothetical protein